MNAKDALAWLLEEVKKSGLKYEYDPISPQEYNKGYLNPHMPPNGLKKWGILSFIVDSEGWDLSKVFELEERADARGISFDTGFGLGYRDWFLDWGFQVVTKKDK